MNYQDLRTKQLEEINGIHITFAFNPKQREEAIAALGAKTMDDVCTLGGGSLLLKGDKPKLDAMYERHTKEMREASKSNAFLVDAMVYELWNHEYCITCDPDEALAALGLSLSTLDKREAACLQVAIARYIEENDGEF